MKDREGKQRLLLKKSIEAHIHSGNYKLAIEECKKYLSLPGLLTKDILETKKKLAELYEKTRDYNNMVKEYLDMTDIYIREGFAAKAPPFLKKAMAVSPNNEQIIEKMTEVYSQMGLKSEVAKAYLQLIDIYAGKKEHYKAVEIYRKLLDLDTGNLQNRVKFIDYLLHIGYTDDAKAEMKVLLETLSRAEDKKVILPLFQKASHLFPEESLKMIAEAYCVNGNYREAINVLGYYIKKTGKKDDPEVFEVLAHAFKGLGNKEKHLLALKELFNLYRKAKDTRKLRNVCERILEVDPSNQEAKAYLQKVSPEKKEEGVTEGCAIIKEDSLSLILTKLDIYLKFQFKGYREKAEELLRSIDLLSIDNDFYLHRIIKLCEKLEYKEHLSLAAYRLAQLYEERKDRDSALKYLNLALTAWPENRAAEEMLSKIAPEKAELMEEKEEIVTEVEIEEEPPEMPTGVQSIFPRREPPEPESIPTAEIEEEFRITPVGEVSDGEFDLEKELASEEKPREEKEEEIKIEIPPAEEMEIPAEEIKIEIPPYREESESPPEEVKIELPEGEEKVLFEPEAKEEIKIELPFEESEVKPEAEVKEERVETRIESDKISSLIQDVEFFKSIGDLDTVRETCHEILKLDPTNSYALHILKEVEESAAPSGTGIEVIEKPPEDEEILQEILQEFKKKVEEICSVEDTATHYELGHAYMEMGLWDEAIKEFEISARDPAKRGPSCSLIMRCYARKGDPAKAMEYYSKAMAENIDPEGKAMLNKEIGDMWKNKGDTAKALEYYRKALSLFPETTDELKKKERAEIERLVEELGGKREEEVKEEFVAEVKDITAARRKKKIHYM